MKLLNASEKGLKSRERQSLSATPKIDNFLVSLISKKIIYPIVLLLSASSVLADYGNMMGYGSGMMWGGMSGMGLFGAIWFALAAFIFSAIFWLTHNWLVKDHKKK